MKTRREKMEIARNARLAHACEKWGILLMIAGPRSAPGSARSDR